MEKYLDFRKPKILLVLVAILVTSNVVLLLSWRVRTNTVDQAFELLNDKEIAYVTDELVELQERHEWSLADRINHTSEFGKLASLRKKTNIILKTWLEKSKASNKRELLFESVAIPTSEQDSLFSNLKKYDSISTRILINQVIPANKIHHRNHKKFVIIFEQWKLESTNKRESKLQYQIDSLLSSEPSLKKHTSQPPFSTYFIYSCAAWFERTSNIPVEKLTKALAGGTIIFPSRGEVSIGSSICKLDTLTRGQLELVCQKILSYENTIDSLLLEAAWIL